EFQLKVWNELCNIPYGETRSYKDIAEKIGNPKAVRAVGGANNKNKLMIIVPCHRVIGANGSLTGYAGGIDVKKILLELEQSK
ncbi:MAG: methylated-DNA--[protein]-cysteine S-methyltransferase, partial [Eubacterium sp.]|nr:methylated-DNA--[protein]-cysteine S-methyltransferase [Eubacterium sp.]